MGVNLRFKKLKNGSKSYYLDINIKNTRKYEFLDIHIYKKDDNKKEKLQKAKELLKSKQEEVSKRIYNQEDLVDYDFIEFANNFILQSPNINIRTYQCSIMHFKKFIGKQSLQFKKIDYALISKFAFYLQGPSAQLSGETPYKYYSKFKQILFMAEKQGYLKRLYIHDIKISRKSINLKKEILTLKEIKLLIEKPCKNPMIKSAFLFACFTGVGLAEALTIKKKDIQGDSFRYTRKKTKQTVTIPVHPTLRTIVNRTEDSKSEYLFSLPSDTTINKTLKKWMKEMGIHKSITFYCARHSFACLLLEHGSNLKTVADCMGHSSTRETTKYLNFVAYLKKEAIMSIPQI